MQVPDVVQRLVQARRLGDKTGAGFYKKVRDPSGASTVLALGLRLARLSPAADP